MFNPHCDMFLKLPEKGLRFANPSQLRKLIRCYAVANARPIRFTISASWRLQARCAPGCPWELWASWMKTEKSFQIKTYNDEHRCVKTFVVKIANSAFISHLYHDKILANPHWKLVDFKKDVLEKYKINVTKTKCYRAKRCALGNVEQILEEHYSKLLDYAAELRRSNPMSTVKILGERPSINQQGYFKRMYVCIDAVKRNWIAGCRPILGLDGCFLKGFCKGQLLSAVGRDGNNHMFPVAWAVVESENKDSWGWFLKLLMEDLGYVDGGGLTLMSDKHIGLVQAVMEDFPRVIHRNCARHVYANLRKIESGTQIKQLFWKAAKCGTSQEFDEIMKEMQEINPIAVEYALSQKKESWSKAFFTFTPVCDAVDNNMSETFNGTIIESRPKPIITMLEEIRIYVMGRLYKKKMEIQKWHDNITPRIRKILEKNKERYIMYSVEFNGGDSFEVRKRDLDGYVVNLTEKSCTCRKWEVSGIPCAHAVAAIYYKEDDPDKYVSPWFTKDVTLKAYQHFIQPLNGKTLWPKTHAQPLLPPPHRRMPGGPKQARRKGSHEEPKRKNTNRISKKGGKNLCTTCNQPGHNIRTCASRPKANTATEPRDLNDPPAAKPKRKRVRGPYQPKNNMPNGTTGPAPRGNDPPTANAPQQKRVRGAYKKKNKVTMANDHEASTSRVPQPQITNKKQKMPKYFGIQTFENGDQYVKLNVWKAIFIKNSKSSSTASTISQCQSSRGSTPGIQIREPLQAPARESPSVSATETSKAPAKTHVAQGFANRTHFKPPRAKGKSPVKVGRVSTRSQAAGVKTRSKA